MAHFLVLSQVFPPDAVSTAHVMGELCEDLAAAGHQVTVLTTTPHYNPDAAAGGTQQPVRSWAPFVKKSRRGGVHVWHVMMPRRQRRPAVRVAAWAWYHAVSTVCSLAIPRADAILACSPPLTIGVCSWLIGLLHRAPFVYTVQELYPDIAVRLGVVREGRLLDALYRLESFIYRRAARVSTISPGMRRRLLEKQVPAEKALLIPNFVDLDALKPLPRDNAFAREHDLVGRFVVSYAGNFGLAQDMVTLLEAASLLRCESGVRIILIGEGLLRESLRQQVKDEALTNVVFLPYQPPERMSEVYGASDLNLVPLAPDAGRDALPSKVYRILACGKPILALADRDSDLATFVQESGCGIVVPPGDPAALAAAIKTAADNPEALAARARNLSQKAVAPYARRDVTSQYRRLLEEVAAARPV